MQPFVGFVVFNIDTCQIVELTNIDDRYTLFTDKQVYLELRVT